MRMPPLAQVASDIHRIVLQIARECPACPRAAILAVLQTPELLEDWTFWCGGEDNLRSVVVPLFLALPCSCPPETAH